MRLMVWFNGVDIVQTHDCIKIHCESYIDRMLQTHQWSKPSPQTSDRHDIVPLTAAASTVLSGSRPKYRRSSYATENHGLLLLSSPWQAYICPRHLTRYWLCYYSPFTVLSGSAQRALHCKSWGIAYHHQAPVTTLCPDCYLDFVLLPDGICDAVCQFQSLT